LVSRLMRPKSSGNNYRRLNALGKRGERGGMMQVPSGRVFERDDLELSRLMVANRFIENQKQAAVLTSGMSTYVYVSGREDLTDKNLFEWQVGRKIARLVKQYGESEYNQRQQCLIGIPTAATAMAQAAAMVSYAENILVNGQYICHRTMRENPKRHGLHQGWVNGEPQPDIHVYWTVENVVTSGTTLITIAERLRQSGYPVEDMPILVFVDRQQGGIKKLEEAGFRKIVVAYNLLDLVFIFGELGLWSKNQVKAVEDEIAANQF